MSRLKKTGKKFNFFLTISTFLPCCNTLKIGGSGAGYLDDELEVIPGQFIYASKMDLPSIHGS